MAKIKIGKGEEPSSYTNHVLVRMTPRGSYQVSGASNMRGIPDSLLSPHFANMADAIEAAMKWAEEHNIKDIHILALDMH